MYEILNKHEILPNNDPNLRLLVLYRDDDAGPVTEVRDYPIIGWLVLTEYNEDRELPGRFFPSIRRKPLTATLEGISLEDEEPCVFHDRVTGRCWDMLGYGNYASIEEASAAVRSISPSSIDQFMGIGP